MKLAWPVIVVALVLTSGCDEPETEIELDVGLAAVSGLLGVLFEPDEIAPLEDRLIDLDISGEDHDYSTCGVEGIECEGEFRTDDTGTYQFSNLMPGTYTLSVDGATATVNGSSVRFLDRRVEVELGHEEDLEVDVLPATYSKDVTVTLTVDGVSPGIPFQYRVKPCSGCDASLLEPGDTEVTNVHWSGFWDELDEATGEAPLSHSVDLDIEADDSFEFWDEECPGSSHCCNLHDFEEGDGPPIDDYVEVSIGGEEIDLARADSDEVEFDHQHEVSTLDPFVMPMPIEVEWRKVFDTAPCE